MPCTARLVVICLSVYRELYAVPYALYHKAGFPTIQASCTISIYAVSEISMEDLIYNECFEICIEWGSAC